MRLFHASTEIIKKPDLKHSRDKLDFGRGFYLTEIREQAISYSERFARRGEQAFLNEYELDDNLQGFNIKTFNDYNEEWLDFVTVCRKGLTVEDYDIVIGGVANDKVFNTIDLYFSEFITKAKLSGD